MHYPSKLNKSVIILLKLMFIKQVDMKLTVDTQYRREIQV